MKTTVISLGGSLIYPNKIDLSFLRKFRKIIVDFSKNNKIIIVCGGGKRARDYIERLKNKKIVESSDLDWQGIKATIENAKFVKKIFGKYAHKTIIADPTKKINSKNNIILAAGWKPGFSTDYDAVMLAKTNNADFVINITNKDYIYDKDPSKYKDAKPLKTMYWKSLQNIVGDKWSPGLNMPFDPIATKLGSKSRIKLFVVGKNLKNLKNLLDHKPFKGTTVS